MTDSGLGCFTKRKIIEPIVRRSLRWGNPYAQPSEPKLFSNQTRLSEKPCVDIGPRQFPVTVGKIAFRTKLLIQKLHQIPFFSLVFFVHFLVPFLVHFLVPFFVHFLVPFFVHFLCTCYRFCALVRAVLFYFVHFVMQLFVFFFVQFLVPFFVHFLVRFLVPLFVHFSCHV